MIEGNNANDDVRPRVMKGTCRAAALYAVMAASLAACGGSSGETGTEGSNASCALDVRYRGESYGGVTVRVAPREGARLGFALLPFCHDTRKRNEASPEQIPIARLPGVSPKLALVWVGRSDMVLVREATMKRLPPEVARLLDPPGCDRKDAPIRLFGEWLGILGADGNTEVDLVAPYNVQVFVKDASARRYERAFLTVRVPTSLRRPITRDDVRSSLWKGGTIEFSTRCRGSSYIAERVRAYSPID